MAQGPCFKKSFQTTSPSQHEHNLYLCKMLTIPCMPLETWKLMYTKGKVAAPQIVLLQNRMSAFHNAPIAKSLRGSTAHLICMAATRCMGCAENHHTKDCQRRVARSLLQSMKEDPNVTIDRNFIKCALCDGNHTANFMGCPARKACADVNRVVEERNKKSFMQQQSLDLNDTSTFPGIIDMHNKNDKCRRELGSRINPNPNRKFSK